MSNAGRWGAAAIAMPLRCRFSLLLACALATIRVAPASVPVWRAQRASKRTVSMLAPFTVVHSPS